MESKPSSETKQLTKEAQHSERCPDPKEPPKIEVGRERWTCDPKILAQGGWICDSWLQLITGDDDFWDEDGNIKPGKRPATRTIACSVNSCTTLFETGGAFYVGGQLSFVLARITWPTTENEILIDLNTEWADEIKHEFLQNESLLENESRPDMRHLLDDEDLHFFE